MINVWVSSPNLEPSARAVSPAPSDTAEEPTGMRALRSGTLNVLDPSPAPNVVPITPNRGLMAPVRKYNAPSQNTKPVGADTPAKAIIEPVGNELVTDS